MTAKKMLGLTLLCLAVFSRFINGQEQDSVERDYSSELPRFQPLTPAEALDSFQVLPGFRIELVAAEPLVTDPIAFAFDANGRLFVVEMRGYSEQPSENLGQIALLEDLDGDGQMDKRTEFVTGLSWPTGVWPWRDGVLVLEPPTITWYRDKDNDGRSDSSEVWFEGFGRSNVQGMVNSLNWGIDAAVHGSSSSVGGSVRQLIHEGQVATSELRRRDFKIDPVSKRLTATSGGGQHGLSFNRWGDKFVTSNSDHLQQVLDLDQWLAAYGDGFSFPALRRSIASDGPQAEVFRSSPVEPWRIVRTRLRVGGIVPGPVEGGGRAAGYFTGATGTLIVDAEAGYSRDASLDTALVCDVGSNLVHRKHLVDHGVFWTGERIDSQVELLTSTDTWFRPVQLGMGPDNCVYIADMYREVIEHPKSLHPVIKKHLDLTSGRDRGRIWRLVSDHAETQYPTQVDMRQLPLDALPDELRSPVRWRRNTAAQQLLERHAKQDFSKVASKKLREVYMDSAEEAEVRVQAFCLAAKLRTLAPDDLQRSLSSSHVRIQEHALRIARSQSLCEGYISDLVALSHSSDARVQLEVALCSATLPSKTRKDVLGRLLPIAQNSYVRAAVAAAAREDYWMIVRDQADQLEPAEYGDALTLGVRFWSQQDLDQSQLIDWLASEALHENADRRRIFLEAVAKDKGAVTFLAKVLESEQKQELVDWLSTAFSELQPPIELLPWLQILKSAEQRQVLVTGLNVNRSLSVQRAMARVAIGNGPSYFDLVLTNFSGFSPSLQTEIVRLLVTSTSGQEAVLQALEDGKVAASHLSAGIRESLRKSKASNVASQAKSLLGQPNNDRQAVVKRYQSSLPTDWSAVSRQNGREHFRKACSQCHRLDSLGSQVGAGLRDLKQKSPEQLLTAILDPNLEVDPRFAGVTVLFGDDQIVSGIVSSESATEIVLTEAGGKQRRLQRSDVEAIQSRGQSLMPEGLEQQVTPAQMVELIHFLRTSS